VDESVVAESRAFGGWDLPSSIVPRGYAGGRSVTSFLESTSVLRSKNLRSIGQRDRWWQYCAVKRTVSPLNVCVVQVLGSY
jgi:hypothetical protein